MNYKYVTTTLATLMLTAASSFAGSLYESDFDRLKQDHDKDLAAAVAPINRRYIAALEQLLRKTTQNNDLDTALKVREALKGVGEAPANIVTVGEVKPQTATKFTISPKSVKKTLLGEWDWAESSLKSWGTFKPNGDFQIGRTILLWEVSPDGTVTVTRPDKAKATFHLNSDLKTFTGTGFDGSQLLGSRHE